MHIFNTINTDNTVTAQYFLKMVFKILNKTRSTLASGVILIYDNPPNSAAVTHNIFNNFNENLLVELACTN